ncbi:MAG: glycosyltransferase family 39 protein [Magnetococcales bacterium]|nr:glycosyltransferase family 39 protein [Magnetococcales bacterium]
METAQDPESGQREWWWLSAILLLALVLRLHGLTFQSHWNDELQSAVLGDPEIPLNLVVRRTLLDVHPPLYQVVLRAWYRTFGYTEFVGRALSVLFGVCGVGALYFLGREVAGRRVGLSAALLGALNVFLIAYSQETRSYALLFLLSSLSWLFFIRLLKDPLWKRTPGYLLSTMALLYTHYFGLFVVMAQGIAFLGHLRVVPQQRGRALRVVGTSGVIAALSLTPLLPFLVNHSAKDSFWIPKTEAWFVVDYLRVFLAGVPERGQVSAPVSYQSVLLIILGLLVVYALLRPRLEGEPRLGWGVGLLLAWIVLALSFPYLRGLVSLPVLTPRNAIIVLPALLILAAIGLDGPLPGWIRKSGLGLIALLSLYFLFVASRKAIRPSWPMAGREKVWAR